MAFSDSINPEPAAKTAAVSPSERWAMTDLPSHLRLWLITALGLAADLWTKEWAFHELKPEQSRVIIKNLCELRLSLNPGALFGLGAGMAPIFVGASVLALLFVLYLFANSSASRWSMHIGLGLVLAGALGNLYDRTTQEAYVAYTKNGGRDIGVVVNETDRFVTLSDFPGGGNRRTRYLKSELRPGSGRQPVVRDFIKIAAKIGRFSLWPWIFNIADALLVIGVAILLLNFWFDRHRHKPSEEPGDQPPAVTPQ